MIKKKILILAGTGAIGIYLTKISLSKGYRVFVTSRKKRTSKNKNLTYFHGNAKNYGLITAILKKERFDVIVDLLYYKNNEFNKNIDLILNSCYQYIYVSSCRVYQNSKNIIDENSPLKSLNNKDTYALRKIYQENVLYKKKDMKWTIVRPYLTYSTNRLQLGPFEYNEILSRSFNNCKLPLTKKIFYNKTVVTWAGDVSRMIVDLYLNKNSYNEIFNLVSDEIRTWEYIYSIYKTKLNLKLLFISESKFLKFFSIMIS